MKLTYNLTFEVIYDDYTDDNVDETEKNMSAYILGKGLEDIINTITKKENITFKFKDSEQYLFKQ